MDTRLPSPSAPQIAAAAVPPHLDPRLLAAVAAQETGGPGADPAATSSATAATAAASSRSTTAGMRSPATRRDGPGPQRRLRRRPARANLERYGGDVRAALSAYNAGSPHAPGTRTDWGDGKPLGYADSVLRHYARLGRRRRRRGDRRDGRAASRRRPPARGHREPSARCKRWPASRRGACDVPLQFRSPAAGPAADRAPRDARRGPTRPTIATRPPWTRAHLAARRGA